MADEVKQKVGYTPGPWGGSDGIVGRLVEGRRAWSNIATVNFQHEPGAEGEQAANEALIRAAPDLLEALKKATELLDNDDPATTSNLAIFRAAIAKAEGAQ